MSSSQAGSEATREVVIPNEKGLHAYPASLITKLAMTYGAQIEIENLESGLLATDARHLLEVMSLIAPQGTSLRISARGDDAPAAVAALADLVARGFDEKQ